MISISTTFVVLLAWGSNVYAGCSSDQIEGTWDVVFSDGNSCRLVLDEEGDVLINEDRSLSTCFDPFRGVTTPDSGAASLDKECSLIVNLLVEGLTIEMYARLTQNRQIGAGFFLAYIPDVYAAKGSISVMPVK